MSLRHWEVRKGRTWVKIESDEAAALRYARAWDADRVDVVFPDPRGVVGVGRSRIWTRKPMLDFDNPASWPKKWLSPGELGVPENFLSDGCTSAPDWSWIHPACRLHDLLYFRGGPELDRSEEQRLRKEADEAMLAVALHNARYDAFVDGGAAKVGWWRYLKRVGAAYGGYFQAVRKTARAAESFQVWQEGQLPPPPDGDFVEAARGAGKWKD